MLSANKRIGVEAAAVGTVVVIGTYLSPQIDVALRTALRGAEQYLINNGYAIRAGLYLIGAISATLGALEAGAPNPLTYLNRWLNKKQTTLEAPEPTTLA